MTCFINKMILLYCHLDCTYDTEERITETFKRPIEKYERKFKARNEVSQQARGSLEPHRPALPVPM